MLLPSPANHITSIPYPPTIAQFSLFLLHTMRIRKRPHPITTTTSSAILPPLFHTISIRIPAPTTLHCNAFRSEKPNPSPTPSMFQTLTLDQETHLLAPQGFLHTNKEHGFLPLTDKQLLFSISKQGTITPGADTESPAVLKSLKEDTERPTVPESWEAEGKQNRGQAFTVSSNCIPVCTSLNQISGSRGERKMDDESKRQLGFDTLKASNKISNMLSMTASEGRNALETPQVEDEACPPSKGEKINGLHEHIPAFRIDYKGKRTFRPRRRRRSIPVKEQYNGIDNHCETRGALFSVLHHMISETGGKGLTVSEAVRRLVEKGYSRLFEIDSLPRSVQVGRALRSNPSVTELENGNFVLLTKLEVKETPSPEDEDVQQAACTQDCSELVEPVSNKGQDKLETSWKRCNRKDGRGWQCHKRCKVGASYCEHHAVKIKANHERSAKKLIARKMSKRVELSNGVNSTATIRTTTITTTMASTTTARLEMPSNNNNIGNGNTNVDKQHITSSRFWSLAPMGSLSSAGTEAVAAAIALTAGSGTKGAVWSWKGQRKRVKARSLKSIEERAASCVVGGMSSKSSCRMALKNKSRMNGELSYNSSNTMEEGKKQKKMGGCMLNSDPKEWRSDLFF